MTTAGPSAPEESPPVEEGPVGDISRPRDRVTQALLRTIGGLLVLAVLLGGLVAYDRLQGSSDVGPLDGSSPEIGEPAPQFVLRDAEGTARTLSDYEGQVVWLNFWATWCGPCERELPDVQALAREFEAEGLVVLTVNFEESVGTALPFWEELELDLPILFDSDGEVASQYRLRGFPDNFFIDREGVLRSFEMGFLTEEQMRERLAELGLG